MLVDVIAIGRLRSGRACASGRDDPYYRLSDREIGIHKNRFFRSWARGRLFLRADKVGGIICAA